MIIFVLGDYSLNRSCRYKASSGSLGPGESIDVVKNWIMLCHALLLLNECHFYVQLKADSMITIAHIF